MMLDVNHYVNLFPQFTLHLTSLWYKWHQVFQTGQRMPGVECIFFQYRKLFSHFMQSGRPFSSFLLDFPRIRNSGLGNLHPLLDLFDNIMMYS